MFVFGGFTGMIIMFCTSKNNIHSSVHLFDTFGTKLALRVYQYADYAIYLTVVAYNKLSWFVSELPKKIFQTLRQPRTQGLCSGTGSKGPGKHWSCDSKNIGHFVII
jgi:hypothetical protein